MSFYIRLMRQEDVAQVTEIDREAFPTEWPPANYRHELQNRLAHYIVACDSEKTVDEPKVETVSRNGLSRLISRGRQLFNPNRFSGNEPPPPGKEYIVGFAGFWVMADEAHITNIAVRVPYRRRGTGELLLIAMIDLAKELNSSIVTLEVRASNTTAQKLYYKYGFTDVGIRHGYYTDNQEDGIVMSTENITLPSFQAQFRRLKEAYSRRWGVAFYHVAR